MYLSPTALTQVLQPTSFKFPALKIVLPYFLANQLTMKSVLCSADFTFPTNSSILFVSISFILTSYKIWDSLSSRKKNRKICCKIGLSIGIQKYIIIGNQKKKVDKNDEKIISDCCEALIGAIFIDQGFNFVKEFILRIWKTNIDKTTVTILDPKTKLQEYSLKTFKKLPFYKLISNEGPRHSPVFKISVSIIGSKEYIGKGNSKQIAQQNGASKLIKDLSIT